MIIIKFRNLYWFTVFNFMLLWLPLLLFGTESGTLVKIIFASEYSTWEGFLEVSKIFSDYAVITFIGAVFIVVVLFSAFKRGEKMNVQV
ncbi:MAG: hypothetical protein EHM47_18030 [Ignavibacteriales bacterium]|nr:MAG: hypothetical protein EHM47_18030 [Ignavibacteriales bacterium]